MGLNNANFIGGLNANDPDYNDLVADSASHVRAIKRALQQTLPSLTGGVTVGPVALNGFETRIAALEAQALTTTPMASGRALLPGTGTFTEDTLTFQPSKLFVMTAVAGAEGTQAGMSFGFTDGVFHDCHSHSVWSAGALGVNTHSNNNENAGQLSPPNRIGFTNMPGSNITLLFTSFTSNGFVLEHVSAVDDESTVIWTAWK